MKKEKSCGIVIFREENFRLYLLLKYSNNYWGFAKGHVEEKENEIETALRETLEETGISDIKIVEGFRSSISYFFKKSGELILKESVFFLGKTSQKEVKLSSEHLDFAWLPYEQAREKLTYENTKKVLDEAEEFLKKLKN
jgi:8-oxo-dGTP pyrophosphatase MutT (NUDIX family)